MNLTNARPHRSQSGFSMLEMLMAAVLMPLIFTGVMAAVDSSENVRDEIRDASFGIHKLRSCLRRIGDELRVSSVAAEDTNENGILDGDEDWNGNGRLESDWSVNGSSITFNRLQLDGTYSLPITYGLVGDMLVRSQLQSDGTTESATLARGVASFSAIAMGTKIIVSMSVASGEESRSSTITIIQRN
jgi:prepilin-type N-terminal cleavage/methylation domain-containing protein